MQYSSGTSTLTIELVYRNKNINEEDNTKIQHSLFLIQDSFVTMYVLEPTRGDNVLDIVL